MRGAQWFSNGWADDATFTDVLPRPRRFALADSGTVNGGVSDPAQRLQHPRGRDLLDRPEQRVRTIDDRTGSSPTCPTPATSAARAWPRPTPATAAACRRCRTPSGGSTPSASTSATTTISRLHPGLNYADASRCRSAIARPGAVGVTTARSASRTSEESTRSTEGCDEPDRRLHQQDQRRRELHARDKTKRVDDFDLFLKNGRQQVLVDPQYLVDPTSLDFAGFGDVLSVDLDAALDATTTARRSSTPTTSTRTGTSRKTCHHSRKRSFRERPLARQHRRPGRPPAAEIDRRGSTHRSRSSRSCRRSPKATATPTSCPA